MSMISYMVSSTKDNANLRKRTKERFIDNRVNHNKGSWNIENYNPKELTDKEIKALELKSKKDLKSLRIQNILTNALAFIFIISTTAWILYWMCL